MRGTGRGGDGGAKWRRPRRTDGGAQGEASKARLGKRRGGVSRGVASVVCVSTTQRVYAGWGWEETAGT